MVLVQSLSLLRKLESLTSSVGCPRGGHAMLTSNVPYTRLLLGNLSIKHTNLSQDNMNLSWLPRLWSVNL